MNENKPQIDKGKIPGMFRKDALLLVIFAVFMWVMLLFVLFQALTVTDAALARVLLIVVALLCGGSLSVAMFQVLFHLHNHKEHIYTEDLENLAISKQQ